MEKILVYNPMYDKTPQGGALKNAVIRFELKIEKSYASTLDGVYLVIGKQGFEEYRVAMTEETSTYQYARFVAFMAPEHTGIYWYYFEIVQKDGKKYFLEQGHDLDAVSCDEVNSKFMQLVTRPQSNVDNFCGGIMYHIFVDRFCKDNVNEKAFENKVYRKDWGGEVNSYIGKKEILNNEFFGGNFDGIISKLDYLKTLGVSTIYLSPIAEANSNHKYDTSDYLKIANEFGGKEAFKRLVKKAKEKDIGIIIDGVYNHTGADSVYFDKFNRYDSVGAYESKDSPYYDWYNFTKYPTEYDCWWGVKILPSIKKDSKPFQDFVCDQVLPYYFDMCIQGIRFDVVDELSNEFIERISVKARELNQDCVLIGEVWEDASNKFAYGVQKRYFEHNILNSVMNYPIRDAIIDYCLTGNEESFVYNIRLIKDHYPKAVQDALMNILGTHDTRRILSVLGTGDNTRESSYKKPCYKLSEEEKLRAKTKLKIASLIQFTIMGVPCIYYGDEVGLEGDNDPYNRRCFPWDNIDEDLYNWYKTLAEIRKNPVFKKGDFNILYHGEGVLVYERIDITGRVLVLINNGKYPFEAKIDNMMRNMFTGEIVKGDIVLNQGQVLVFERI